MLSGVSVEVKTCAEPVVAPFFFVSPFLGVAKHMEDWWKPPRDVLIVFQRGMFKLYEPQEFSIASEENIQFRMNLLSCY